MMNENLYFREALIEDEKLIFQWRNIDEIIALSSSQLPVSWNEHINWFREALSNPNKLILIIVEDSKPIGQVRFDKSENGKASNISIYLIPDSTGKGRGAFIIHQACLYASKKWPQVFFVHAIIRKENIRSIKSFKNAGFKLDASENKINSSFFLNMFYEFQY
jgi:RimJ/RimL family protein N-acetyltransferase